MPPLPAGAEATSTYCTNSPTPAAARLARFVSVRLPLLPEGSSGTSTSKMGPSGTTKSLPREPGPSTNGAPGRSCNVASATSDGNP